MGLWDMVVSRKAPEYYRRQNQEKDMASYRGLLEEYDQRRFQPQDPSLMQAGPTQTPAMPAGQAGLLDRATQQQFLMRASAIPGYENLAQGFLRNEGGLQQQQMQGEQQMRQQQYLNENMSQQQRYAMQQQQPLVDARTAQAYAAGGASDASAANSYASAGRTNQGRIFDAQRQPWDLSKLQAEAVQAQAKPLPLSPLEIQANAVNQADMIAANTQRRGLLEQNDAAEQWNNDLDSYAAEALEARSGVTGMASAATKARLATKREQLVTALAKQMTGGTAEPNPGVVERAGQMIPEIGVFTNQEAFKAAMAPLRRAPKRVPAPATLKAPPGFRKVQ